jgi:hypothetical protein
MNYLQTRDPLNPNLNVLSGYRTIYKEWMQIVRKELPFMTYGHLGVGGRKTFTRKYKNRKYKVSSKRVRKSSYKRNNTYRNKRHSRRH